VTAPPCGACGQGPLVRHLSVSVPAPGELAATTTAFGSAPGDILRCRACGHMQVDPLPAQEALGEDYAGVSDAAYLDEELGQRATARRALRLIERHRRRGAIADLGCWVGFLLSEAERRGWTATGVEPSRFASELARERFGLDVRTGTIEGERLPPGSFDAVVLGDVIEHLPDPGAALARVRSLLRPGGVIYLALPDAGSRVARTLRARWWSVLPTHVHYFTRASIATLLARAGYAVEWMGTAPKAFSLRYYLERLQGYSPPLASAAVAAASRLGLAERLVCPDFRDRMAVIARMRTG
jgi:SAM-dependent methyltransferase